LDHGADFEKLNSIEQELILESDSEEAALSESDNGQDEDVASVGCDNNVNGSQVHI
jgi:hypothetical protein